ncbi:MAG: T9SS type A sorting domain-containing protein [Bacteroidaceae bacterium]|nr:T9SS type A sorting domain-containing protein [Bacteroidaceae bacterium]
MTKNFYSKVFRNIMLTIGLMTCINTSAQEASWEQIYKLPATNAFHIARNGNLIMADYQFDLTGGIYISEDKGATWTKTGAPDYTYNIFVENDEYIFAAGCEARVGRSNDGGKTWETLSYKRAVEDALGEYADYTNAYALTMHNGKLFLGDFSGGGVIYSEDNGETWHQTDIEALSYGEVDPKLGKRAVENIYNLTSFNGDLYAFGVYLIFRYLPETNSWEVLREDCNFMAITTVYNGKMYGGRSVMNYTTEVPFIETLDTDTVWGAVPRPETDDNNIRALLATDKGLFVGMGMSGVYYTPDEGASWATLNNGIPYSTGYSFTPMGFAMDEKYVYLAAYEPPFSSTTNSGLYRFPLKDLPSTTGIKTVEAGANAPQFNGSTLTFAAGAQQAAVYDLSGRMAPVSVSGNSIDVRHLTPGTYIYKANINGQTVSGKFLKK